MASRFLMNQWKDFGDRNLEVICFANPDTHRTPLSMSGWGITDISPDGEFTQKVEGKTRKTWKFSDLGKDRVQVAITKSVRKPWLQGAEEKVQKKTHKANRIA